LISIPSLRGNEYAAQELMAGEFKRRGLEVDQFDFDFEALAKHPAAGIVDEHHSRAPIVVGRFQPRGQQEGHSLILNARVSRHEPSLRYALMPYCRH
jgi:hypothetical protein